MTRDQIFDVLRPIIMSVTGVPECILENPNREAPSGEYAAVNPKMSPKQKGQAIIDRVAKPGMLQGVNVRRQVETSVAVNFYRGDSRSRAELLIECHKLPNIADSLFRARIGWGGIGPINDLTSLQSENFESRAHVQIELLHEIAIETDINSIESVEVRVQNEQGTVIEAIEVSNTPP